MGKESTIDARAEYRTTAGFQVRVAESFLRQQQAESFNINRLEKYPEGRIHGLTFAITM